MNLARKRLGRKLLVVFVAPVVLGFVVTGFISIRTTRDALFTSSARALADNLATFRSAALPSAMKGRIEDGAGLAGLVERVAAEETVHAIAVYDDAGRPLARSSELTRPLPAIDAEVARVLASGAAVVRVVRVGGDEVLLRAEPARGAPGVGALVMTRELASIDRTIRVELGRLALTGGMAALLVSLIAFVIARILGHAWGTLVDAAERVAKGELDVHVEASSLLELDRVARAFNAMTRSLAEAREKLLAAEAERIEQAARMRHAQSLAVVGQVAGSFAHEIGSPLSTILGWSRLGAADEGSSPAARRQFETIAAQSERLARIVERLLAGARPAKDRIVAVDLADVVREVTTFLAPDLRVRRVELRVLVAEPLPSIITMRDRLIQVVMNLCVNAIQAQPQGGILRISLAADEGEAEAAPQIRLEVADAGPGIPEAERARIFEPFYTTKEDRGGTGLGLPIVADVVRELGGKIEVEEAPEGGALFRVLWPFSAAPR
jgi:signal transduction histidine kinase